METLKAKAHEDLRMMRIETNRRFSRLEGKVTKLIRINNQLNERFDEKNQTIDRLSRERDDLFEGNANLRQIQEELTKENLRLRGAESMVHMRAMSNQT